MTPELRPTHAQFPKGMPYKERLKLRSIADPASGCVLWCGPPRKDGYGQLNWGRRPDLPHRVAWQEFVGPIPEGLGVLHRCDNRICINPAHLFLGTLLDNMADRDAKGRQVKGEKAPNAKLTEDGVRLIRASDLSVKDLAAKFGVGHTTIRSIRARRKWRHV